MKNKTTQDLSESIVKIEVTGAEVSQRFQLSSVYNLVPHNEISVIPFIIKTAETPIEITIQIISKNKIIFNEAKQIEMQKTEF